MHIQFLIPNATFVGADGDQEYPGHVQEAVDLMIAIWVVMNSRQLKRFKDSTPSFKFS